MTKLVSIVVPVFNTEKYINRCIDSLLNQSYSSTEIVLVDDESSDRSGVICDEYASDNRNVVVYHKTNQGAFSARRYGVEKANGEYVVFVDSDDYVEKDYVLNLVNNIGECDVCTSGCIWVNIDESKHIETDNFKEKIYKDESLKDVYKHMIFNYGRPEDYYRGILTYMVCKLYKKELALSIFSKLDEKMQFCEDGQFVFTYLLNSKSISITHGAFYNYCHRADSITHQKMNHYLDSLERLYNSILKQAHDNEYESEIKIQIEEYINYRLKLAPHYMQFSCVKNRPTYEFPYWGDFEGKRVVLYGAGNIGKDYYREIISVDEFKLVAWVDKNYEQIRYPAVPEIMEPEIIKSLNYDAVIVAVGESQYESSIEDLINMGIPRDKIYWRKPNRIRYYD
ncbi:glycosyltransferase [Pseudobutyrivibrio ruminis]|uniref:glycosyltransferase n=1 Tax=Pseudobutyrivibrio ruminis TaxID=46206 RepID=UPI00041CB712|nr:glycosyltransferase [Pseudobutyrivibrio ruminis]